MNLRNFFLKNIGIRQTIIKNTFWLVSAEGIARISSLFLVIYIARILGANDYGKFTFAFSFASIIGIFSNMGVAEVLTRELSRNKENEKKIDEVLGLQVFLSISALAGAVMGSFLITDEFEIRKVLWILFFFVRARQKMEYEAGIKFFQTFLNLVVVMAVIFSIPSIINISYGYLASNLIILVVALLYFNFYFQRLKIKFKKESFEILRSSWPLSLGLM